MNEHQLRCFVVSAKYLNFTKAAEELYMTQSAMTYQISEMEKELDSPLFDRLPNKLSLTQAGLVFLTSAKDLLEGMERSRKKVQEIGQKRESVLRIACYGDVMFPFLPRLLQEFRAEYPAVAVSLEQGIASEIVDKLRIGELDIGFLTGYGDYVPSLSWIEKTLLMRDWHCAVLPKNHPRTRQKSLAANDLMDEKKILLAERDLLDHENPGMADGDILYVNDPQSVTTLVEAGYGVSVCVSHVAPWDNPQVICIPIEDSFMNVYACSKKGMVKQVAASFLRLAAKRTASLGNEPPTH